MAKKVLKAKATSSKPSTLKKVVNKKKLKGEEKLSNGVKDNGNENAESDVKTEDKSIKKIDIPEETKNGESEKVATDSAEEGESSESRTSDSQKSRKRKAAVQAKGESSKTKTKKVKVQIEIPKRSSISGKVFVVGDNDVGQLGLDEDTTEVLKPKLLDLPYSIVDVCAGGMHSICLTESGEVITFGCNDEGALGRITTDESSEFTPCRVDLPERIIQVSAGDSHTAALSESGNVYIWGNFRNANGPLGLVSVGTKQITPVRILNDVTVVKISSGNDHLTCLSQEGIVYTCGVAEAGQLGRISEHTSADGGRKGESMLITPDKVSITNKSVTIDDIWSASCATFVKASNGSIYAFGLNNYNQLGVNNPNLESADSKPVFKPMAILSFNNKTWVQISGSLHHTIAQDDNGVVYSLGRSEYGRLGLGENSGDRSEPTAIPSLQDTKCIDISCGPCVSFAVADNGSVYSWGMGTSHQLGHGDEEDQYTPKCVESDFLNSWKALKIAGGGQHTLILAQPRQTSN